MAADISKYVNALKNAGADIYEVGGPVRDQLLGRNLKDHDLLCRKLSVQQITKVLTPFGKVAAVGKAFGVIKFSPNKYRNCEIDIALPRKEISTGSGHRDFEVNFDPDLPIEDDLGRRDFTINAMAISFANGELIDLFDGQKDLKDRILRMVFPRAFEEDPLRLIRGIQFASRFNLSIEQQTWKAMCDAAPLIKTVSGERIGMEILKMMTAEKPSVGFDLMNESGLLNHILPELSAIKNIEQDKQPGDDVYKHTMRVLDAARSDSHVEHCGDPELLFAALLHDTGKAKTARTHPEGDRTVFFGHQIVSARLARKWMNKMKLSSCGINTKNVVELIEHHMFETKAYFTDRAIRRFVAKIGKDLIYKLMDMRLSDNRGGKHPSGIKGVLRLRKRIRDELAKKPPFGPKDLAISGHDLMALGISEGPIMGIILKSLVETVLDDPALNEREKLLALAKEILENPPSVNQKKDSTKRDDDEETESRKSGCARS
ncbi:MAG: HD domain-containing protein [Deltaproteobacteria bacterium]|jgi:tRNA nucleotidyltransferase (CCA-adding enzyme)|nr:HD domain-containing protein [Deltaproteobacteria bacterium]